MRLAFALLALLCVPALACAEDVKPEDRVFVEWQTREDPVVYVGEDVWVGVRVGFDHAHFLDHGVQLFREKLDAPLQVTAHWPGTVADRLHAPVIKHGVPRRFVLNGQVTTSWIRFDEEQRDGRTYVLLRDGRYVRFDEPGQVVLPAPAARFAFAERFEEDFDGERVAVDPRFFTVAGEPVTLDVRALPEAGRPADFTGAIGLFKVTETSVDRTEVQVGEAVALTLRIGGFGNLARIRAPRFEGGADWHLLGVQDGGTQRGTAIERAFVYELVPQRAGRMTIPPIEFSYFFTGEEPGYRMKTSDPVDVVVRAAPGPGPASDAPARAHGPREESPLWPYVVFGALAGALAVLLVGRALHRRTVAAPALTQDTERIEAARAALDAHADERTLTAFLAAHLECRPAAIVGEGLLARLEAAGVAPPLAARTGAAMEALVAARYGGGPASIDPALVAALQAALTT